MGIIAGMKKPQADYETLLEEANERFELIQSLDKDNRENHKADTLFVYSPGNQWPDDVKTTRKAWKELCLEFNQLKQFVGQVVNDQRQNRPGIKIHPASGDASKDTAKIIQGMCRGIEYDSNAEAVYDSAFQSAVVGGRGWWRVCSEYEDGDTFNQKLVIKPIQDVSTVFADVSYTQPDGSDREYVFVIEKYSKNEFLRKWPDKDPISWDKVPGFWSDGEDSIIVADYYRRVCKKRTLVLMSDGAQGYKDEMPTPPEGVTIMKEREMDQWSVEWVTIAGGQQVLDEYEWPGSVIPVVCAVGDDMILDGKRVYQGLTRHARDAQSMLNFGMTQQAIHLSLTPRAPWVIAEGQIEGYEGMWRDANTKNYNALIYKPTTIEGIAVPPPQRTQPAMVADGWDRWCTMMIGMIKSTIGMYEQSLGQKGNEVSGRAITAREKQGDTATFNFVDNLARAIALTGRIIVEAMPKFYDTERIVHIIGPDDVRKMETINQMTPSPDDPMQAIMNNDVTSGKYSVTVEAGPSYATKRQETSESLMQLVQAFPPVAQVAGDLIVKSLDIADADIIAERLKTMLPPQILQAEAAKEEGKAPPDPQMQAKLQEQDQHLQQAAQTMEAMHTKIQELETGAQAKIKAIEADAAAKTKAAEVDGDVTIRKALIDADAKVDVAKIAARADLLIAKLKVPADIEETGEEQEFEGDGLGSDENGQLVQPKPSKVDQLAEMQGQMLGAIHTLAQTIANPPPKMIIRGPDGRAIGVQ